MPLIRLQRIDDDRLSQYVDELVGNVLQVARGPASGEDDGKYGPKTAAAVIAFQRYMGIKEDGVVGTQTLARLQLVLDGEDDTAANLGTDSES